MVFEQKLFKRGALKSLSPAEDALGLAQAIRELYDLSEKERLNMETRGRAYYGQYFSHHKLVDKLIKYPEQALSRYKGSTL